MPRKTAIRNTIADQVLDAVCPRHSKRRRRGVATLVRTGESNRAVLVRISSGHPTRLIDRIAFVREIGRPTTHFWSATHLGEKAHSSATSSFITMSSKPLVVSDSAMPLYSASCVLSISADVAQGFVILLTGGPVKKDDKEESTITLGFLAITEGNVVDACFGVETNRKSGARRQAQGVKQHLAMAADDAPGLPKVAVEAYRNAFIICQEFHASVGKLQWWNFCFHYAKLQHDAEMRLKEAFAPLEETLAAV